ncbi:capsular polysaccharide export protein, LipB/KpsS family [Halobaculum roseum]|uniref:Capsular biosynthesis protein n=1 Tax=Halobaculum roseum TaxID=2175149 RepID=A0ABD5MK87_9EURY|nr:hypothetical protein [Halobaculum roseum]QZY03240.1 hypothetical protein K6T36_03400 [Halobaculum roseum]
MAAKVAFDDVSLGKANLWTNLADNITDHGNDIYFINPNTVFRKFLEKNNFEESIIEFSDNTMRDIPVSNVHNYDIIDHEMNHSQTERKSLKDLEVEYNNYCNCLDKFDIDIVIFWNDMSIGKIACEAEGVSTLFLENGYLNDTIQIDRQGVNSNSSVFGCSFEEIISRDPLWKPMTDEPIKKKKYEELTNVEKLKGHNNSLSIVENIVNKTKNVLSKGLPIKKELKHDLPSRFVFLPLQVNSDTQVLYNSPYVKNMKRLYSVVLSSLNSSEFNMELVVKEHPAEIKPQSYSSIKKHSDNVLWLKEYDINTLIEQADLVVTINSSVGFQSLAKGTPIVVIGEAMYSSHPNARNPDELQAVQDAMYDGITSNYGFTPDNYINAFRNNIFIEGSFNNFYALTLKKIISAIYNSIE